MKVWSGSKTSGSRVSSLSRGLITAPSKACGTQPVNKDNTSLKSPVGTESNRQVVGLEDQVKESGPDLDLVLQVVLWFLDSRWKLFESLVLSMSLTVDGFWSGWSSWGECSSSCIAQGRAPVRTRYRSCSNPPPSSRPPGKGCQGDNHQIDDCNHTPHCPGTPVSLNTHLSPVSQP